jgi:hypothetical protein
MPLEISEITVRLAVEGGAPRPAPAPAGAGARALDGGTPTPEQIDVIVGRCVREVLRALNRNEAR